MDYQIYRNAKIIIRSLRPRHWSKNALVALPLLLNGNFSELNFITNTIAVFLVSCLAASFVYLGNDLLDKSRDRQNPRTANRPIAAGLLPIQNVLTLMGLLLVSAIGISLWLPQSVILGLFAYITANIAYSSAFRRLPLLDACLLACMQVWRIAMGCFATGLSIPGWVFASAACFFFSLAIAKRHIWLTKIFRRNSEAEYRLWNRINPRVLFWLGLCGGLVAIAISSLYLLMVDVPMHLQALISSLVSVIVAFVWVLRFWWMVHRHKVPEDPVRFVTSDLVSYLTIAIVVLALLLSPIGTK